jgi:hypothetical protein
MARKAATPTTEAPARATRTRKAPAPAAPAFDIPTDPEDLFKALKSAKGVLWTMNDRRAKGGSFDSAKIVTQEAKIDALQDAWDAVKPPRQNGGGRKIHGPSWVVTVDPASGKIAKKAAEGADVTRLAAEGRDAGLAVLIVAKGA